MNKYCGIVLALLALLAVSCASQHIYKGVRIYENAQGQPMCGLHHQPLIQKSGYTIYYPLFCPTEEYVKWALAFPNNDSAYQSYKEDDSCKAVTYYYCPECNKKLAEKLD